MVAADCLPGWSTSKHPQRGLFSGGASRHVFYVADIEAAGRALDGELRAAVREGQLPRHLLCMIKPLKKKDGVIPELACGLNGLAATPLAISERGLSQFGNFFVLTFAGRNLNTA